MNVSKKNALMETSNITNDRRESYCGSGNSHSNCFMKHFTTSNTKKDCDDLRG
jgi:hypothetical protein